MLQNFPITADAYTISEGGNLNYDQFDASQPFVDYHSPITAVPYTFLEGGNLDYDHFDASQAFVNYHSALPPVTSHSSRIPHSHPLAQEIKESWHSPPHTKRQVVNGHDSKHPTHSEHRMAKNGSFEEPGRLEAVAGSKQKAQAFCNQPAELQEDKAQPPKVPSQAAVAAPQEPKTRIPKPKLPKAESPVLNATAELSLPTGENVVAFQLAKRFVAPGFPAVTEPLPADIQDEEIIRSWPNHLWGPLLLKITAHFTPKEIGALNQAKINANTIAKRVRAAKQNGYGDPAEVKTPGEESNKRKREPTKEKSSRKGGKKQKVETILTVKKTKEERDEEEAKIPEPEASRAFRLAQMEIQREVRTKDPSFYVPKMFGGRKRNYEEDRELLDNVVKEREAKRQKM